MPFKFLVRRLVSARGSGCSSWDPKLRFEILGREARAIDRWQISVDTTGRPSWGPVRCDERLQCKGCCTRHVFAQPQISHCGANDPPNFQTMSTMERVQLAESVACRWACARPLGRQPAHLCVLSINCSSRAGSIRCLAAPWRRARARDQVQSRLVSIGADTMEPDQRMEQVVV